MTKVFAFVVLCQDRELPTFLRYEEEPEIRIFANTNIRVSLHYRLIVIADVYILDEIGWTKA